MSNLTDKDKDTLTRLLNREAARLRAARKNRAARGIVFTPEPGKLDLSVVRERNLLTIAKKLKVDTK